jgi:uncharacterized membrane protein
MSDRYHLALFLHLLGVLVLTSGIVVAGAAHTLARTRRTPEAIAALLTLARVGVLLAAPGAVLVVGAGIWLVDIEGLSLDTGWLRTAILLFVLSAGLGAGGGRRPKQARLLATELAEAGRPGTDDLRVLLDDRRAQALNLASAVAMLGVLALMVFKP